MSKDTKQQDNVVRGTVLEALPNTMFRVQFPGETDGEMREVIAYLSGKMRYHRIKVLVGDSVEVLLDSYGGEKGRITRRH